VLYTVWIVYVTLDTGHSFELGVFTVLYTVWIVYVTLDTGNSFELGVFTVLYTVWIVYVTLDTGHSFELGVFTVLYTVQRVRFKACLPLYGHNPFMGVVYKRDALFERATPFRPTPRALPTCPDALLNEPFAHGACVHSHRLGWPSSADALWRRVRQHTPSADARSTHDAHGCSSNMLLCVPLNLIAHGACARSHRLG
jgi:hypothetical protein